MQTALLHNELAEGPDGGRAFWLTASDGVRIRAAFWGGGDKGTVLLFPGRTEYVEKYGRAAGALHARGFNALCIDWRGQGLADRLMVPRSYGHVEHFVDYQKDVAALLACAAELDAQKPLYLIAHSMGGGIGLRALMEGLPVNAAVFSAPMWGIKMGRLVRPYAWGLSELFRRVGLGKSLTPGTKAETVVEAEPFEGNNLTHDPEMFAYMARQARAIPDASLGGPTLHWLNEALRETRQLATRPSPDVPCLTFLGTEEDIVDPARIHARMPNWPNATLEIVDGARHEIIMETPPRREMFFDKTAEFFARHA